MAIQKGTHDMQPAAHELLACGQRTIAWAKGLLGSSGFANVSDQLLAHYKATTAFALSGHPDGAMRIADHLGNSFRNGGDFHGNPRDTAARSGGANYRNAWIARGLHLLGRYELSEPSLAHLEAQLDIRSGGCHLRPSGWGGDVEIDFGTTCSAAIALLAAGRIRSARRCGEFLSRSVLEQLQPGTRLHLRFSPSGVVIAPKVGSQAPFVIDAAVSSQQQLYWPLGMALVAFARLTRATGDGCWQEPADALLNFIARCGPDVATHITNGKIAWGLGEMSLISPIPTYRTLAETVLRNIIAAQEPSGIWVRRPEFDEADEQPIATSLDTSLERASYMFDLAKVFVA